MTDKIKETALCLLNQGAGITRDVVLSLLGFIAFWTVVTDAQGYSSYLFSSENGVYYYGYITCLVWVMPAVLLIGIKDDYLTLASPGFLPRAKKVVCVSEFLLCKGTSFYDNMKGLLQNIQKGLVTIQLYTCLPTGHPVIYALRAGVFRMAGYETDVCSEADIVRRRQTDVTKTR